MGSSLQLAGYDFVIIGILLLFTIRGFWVGFLCQITTLVALLLGYIIAGQYHDKLFPFLRGVTENPHAVFWISYVILFAITYVVIMLIGRVLAKVVEMTIAGWFDKLLGGALGLVKAVILVVILNMVLSGVLSPEHTMLRNCFFSPYLKQGTEIFQSFIKDDAMRDAFSPKKPAIPEKKPAKTEKAPKRSADGVRPFVPTQFPEDEPAPVK
jgi:membrane protein required for colicin V production